MKIRELRLLDIPKLLKLTDDLIGKGYYSEDDLIGIYTSGIYKNEQLSLVLENDGQIKGFRFTLAPQCWDKPVNRKKWKVKDDIAYFQSIFLDKQLTGKGLGVQMSKEAIAKLTKLGIKAIVCHSHVESPHNSSLKYLNKLGFQPVNIHKQFWGHLNYTCDTCKINPCLCTAMEMILYLEDK